MPALVAPVPPDFLGLLLVLFVAARLAPSVREVVEARVSDARVAFALAFVLYAAVASWDLSGMFAQGDQAHYILAAESLRAADLDIKHAYIDLDRYRALTGQRLTEEGIGQHVVDAPAGPRLIQGYGLPLLILPGWTLAGRLGVTLTMAALAALASAAVFLLLRDLCGDARQARLTWLLTTALAPLLPLATVVYPNAVGAAVLALAFRWLFTATPRRETLAGLAAGITFALSPRDGLVAILLLLFAVSLGPASLARFARPLALTAAAVTLVDLLVYGIPLPYAGYVLGFGSVSALQGESLLALQPHIALPGMLFDRTRGLAATAPWVFIGALGITSFLRANPRVARGALGVVAATILALAAFREWQGGWAPPNRYLVDVLPFWTPFVAYGVATAQGVATRAVSALLVAWSAAMSLLIAAIPAVAYEARLEEWFARFVPAQPLGWLPSFAADDGAALPWSALLLVALTVFVLFTRRKPAFHGG